MSGILSTLVPADSLLVAKMASVANSIGRFEKLEMSYPYTGSYANPNDPGLVDVEATFTSPTHTITVPGFFYQPYARSGSARGETLTPSGTPQWMVRFAPTELGSYTYHVTLKDSSGMHALGSGGFTSVPSSNPGFIRASGYHLVRDDGEPFIPVGLNAPWWQPVQGHPGSAWGDGTYGVDNMYAMFAQTGSNFFHFWTCAGASSMVIGCDLSLKTSTADMDQAASWEIDYMATRGHASGIYMMPILKHQDQQQYTSADRIKARYFVARWGYETNLVAWDWNKEGATNPAANAAWSSYEQLIDPYAHLRTTSEWNHYPTLNGGDLGTYNQVFADPNMTLVQNHDYTGDCTDGNLSAGNPYDTSDPGFGLFYMRLNPQSGPLRGQDPRAFDHFHKPSFLGETGVHNTAGLAPCVDKDSNGPSASYAIDHKGLIIKSQAWGTLMSTACACAPWMFRFDPSFDAAGNWTGAWTQLAAFHGLSAYAKALPAIPDNARLFTSHKDATAVVTSAPTLRVIGRKNDSFAMLDAQNITGTALNILHGQTPVATSGTVTLKGMRVGASFSVRWFDTDSGTVERIDTAAASPNGDLTLTLPVAVTQNIAAIVLGPASFTHGGTGPGSGTSPTASGQVRGGDQTQPSGGGSGPPAATSAGEHWHGIVAALAGICAAIALFAAAAVVLRRRRSSQR